MKKLFIAPDLALPLDAATQTFAFIARKGAGKSYAAGKLVEQLLDVGVQVIVLDTVGNWYGLRIAADGKGQGFDIPLIGGLRGDLPLQATAGELVADVAVETGHSMILDVSQFSLADRKRFATAFGERLWKNKKAETHPTPLMLVLEESQLIVPQFSKGAERMLGIYEEIIRLGRNYGIGAIMISQRPQSVNKEVLNQTECLFVLQVNGAQERKALRDWIVYQGMDPALLNELPSLPVGTAYVWSPQWLGILQKVKIAPKRTFDSSATPKVGVNIERRELTRLDMTWFETRMTEMVEQAKADDPNTLRERIASLELQVRQLDAERKRAVVAAAPATVKETFVFRGDELERLENARAAEQALAEQYNEVMRAIEQARMQLGAIADEFTKSLGGRMAMVDGMNTLMARALLLQGRSAQSTETSAPATLRHVSETPAPRGPGKTKTPLSTGARKILNVLAQYPSGRSKVQLALLTGYSSRGGGFNNLLGGLRTIGFISGTEDLYITAEGRAEAGEVVPIPVGQALFEYWQTHPLLGKAEREILRALWQAQEHGFGLRKEAIAAHAGYAANGGGFGNALGRLNTLELICKERDLYHLAEVFR